MLMMMLSNVDDDVGDGGDVDDDVDDEVQYVDY
jgi:hypothetical protein